MREIEFRGKTEDGTWIYGGYFGCNAAFMAPSFYQATEEKKPKIIKDNIIHCISIRYNYQNNSHIAVIPETVGQFTGLLDKNTRRIYEGDIVESTDDEGDYATFHKQREIVEFQEGCFIPVSERHSSNFEIIGNIYDNPELMDEK